MRSALAVSGPASTLQMLSIEEMRAIAGVTGSGQDAALNARGLAVAANIAAECKITIGSGSEPTLWQETLTETFYGSDGRELRLSRRHNVEIISITVDGEAIDPEEYFVEPESGIIHRVHGFGRHWTCCQKTVVVYKAGFETLPGDLKEAASDLFRAFTREDGRDPYVKSETVEIPGVETVTTELWSGSLNGTASAGGMPESISSQLTRYRNAALA